MDLERRSARELILWKLGDALEEVVCDSHGTHGVRTRRSGAHLVELLERRHDWALRGLDHPEFGRKGGSCRSRLGSCFGWLLLGASGQQRGGGCGQGGVAEFSSAKNCWSLTLALGWSTNSTSGRIATSQRTS